MSGRLKALLYRARGQLNQLEEKAGHQMILHEKGRYTWNPAISSLSGKASLSGAATGAGPAGQGMKRQLGALIVSRKVKKLPK